MKTKKAIIGIIAAVGLSLAFAAAPVRAMDVEKVPNPLASAGLWVGDNGGVLGPDYIKLINAVCETLKVKTGAEFAVITVDSLDGLAIEDFAARLFKRFGIGVAGQENGLLLLFSREDRRVRLEVGYGLEGTIPDGLASRLLDEQALPFFREGEYGRGMFNAAKAAAEAIGNSAATPLDLSAPAVWPAQLVPPQLLARDAAIPESPPAKKVDVLSSTLISGGAVVLVTLIGFFLVTRKVAGKKGRAAKLKAARGDALYALTWLGSIGIFAALAGINKTILPYLLSLGAAPAASSIGLTKALKSLRRKILDYQETCPKCGQLMRLLDEKADDMFLTIEEVAEENAGGMDYEVWQCPSCKATESFSLKLGKAADCPKCARRTLVTTTTTLLAATRTSGGKVKIEAACKNPSCDYLKITEHRTPRLPPPSSGSSSASGGNSFGSSGQSSFGGGRSGGGGASKGW